MATITGGAGDDLLPGTAEGDLLLGGGGDDTLVARGGEDTLDGGAGRDRAVLDRSGDTAPLAAYMPAPGQTAARAAGAVLTGVEDHTVLAGSGADGLVGGAGNDSLSGGAGDDSLQGGAGTDTLVGGDGADWLLGGAGADVLAGGSGADRFVLIDAGGAAPGSTLAATDRVVDFTPGAGDRLVLRGQAAGTALHAIASGTFAPPGGGGPLLPVGFGGALAPAEAPAAGLALPDPTGGAAWLLHWLPAAAPGDGGGWLVMDLDRDGALGAADFVARFDLPSGAAIAAEHFVAGTFALTGTGGGDALAGGAGGDAAFGFGGADRLDGDAGDDALDGGDGNDTLLGGADSDTLDGGAGADGLLGGGGIDLLRGGAGDDALDGGEGADLLRGEAGDDLLGGGAGDDTLVGGEGSDTLVGGAGADLFVLREDGRPAGPGAAVLDFDRGEGDRLRLSSAWPGFADGSGATAGTIAGPDGVARPLLFVGGLPARESLALGAALPAPRFPGLDARAVFWIPAEEGGAPAGGWLVLDADGDGALGAADLVARAGSAASPVTIGAADFVAGTFFANEGGRPRAGTAGDDTLVGGTLGETFLGGGGSDRIEGGAGSANAIAYDALAAPVAVRFTGHGAGTAAKADGGTDAFTGIHAVSGTDGADTLDAAGAAAGAAAGLFAISLQGGRGNDRIVGDRGHGAQATYAAGSPFAVAVDLLAGTAEDGWGGLDSLVDVRRVAVAGDGHDTVRGSAQYDLFLSAGGGNKLFDGRGGFDEYRWAGAGAVTVALTPPVYGGVAESAYVLKPGGSTDRLHGVEAVSGGSGDDSIVGSAAAERLSGGAGNDTLDGGGGLDTVRYDLLSPGAPLPVRGAVVDLAVGAATDPWGGRDALRRIENAWGSHGADDLKGVAVAGNRTWLRGLAGADTLRAASAGTLITADHAADPWGIRANLAAGAVVDGWGDRDALVLVAHLRGSAFDDSVLGAAAANWLDGGAGDDTLDGGAGADTLLGGAGNDVFFVDDARDATVELAGDGDDTVFAALSWALGADIEVLVLTGMADANGTGNDLANRIAGNAGANALSGGDGHDMLRGGPGSDTLDGGAGNDDLSGGDGHDLLRGGDGDDTLDGGPDADTLDGGPGHDALSGGDGPDALRGGDGDDALDGGAGDDTLLGGADADLLLGGSGADLLDGGAGDDTLDGGSGAGLLRGGEGADSLRGGPETDVLDGGAGDDTLSGEGGTDALRGGDGADLLWGGADAETLEGGEGGDALLGRDGADLLVGDGGDGLLLGAAGADTLRAGGGADLLLGGAGGDLLDGGDGDDTLDGGAGDDTLDGGAGANPLFGGAGDDLYVVRGAADLVFEAPGGGSDTVQAAASHRLGPDVEVLVLTGVAGIDGYGNAAANRVIGNAGANRLDGGAGDDTLDGGAGPDTLYGGAGDDLFHVDAAGDAVVEWAGQGRDAVVADFGPGGHYALPAWVEALVLAGATANGTGNDLANRIEGNGVGNTIRAGAGDDTLLGGGGDDVLEGGAGADLFVFDPGMGFDRVADFEPGVDRLLLRGLGVSDAVGVVALAVGVPGGALIDFGGGQRLLLGGVSAARLGAADLLFG